MDTDLIEILKYILIAISVILVITLLVSFLVSKLKGDSNSEVDAGNLIKSPEPKVVRTSSTRKVQDKPQRSSSGGDNPYIQPSHHSSEKRRSTGNSEYSREQQPRRKTNEEPGKVTRSTGTNGQNTPRMQVLTDLKNPNKRNIQDQYLGGGY